MTHVTRTSSQPPGQLPTGELDLTGRTIADFHVLRHLGQGGMGQVYLAEQVSLKRKVALKILRPELATDPSALLRFKAEAEAVARATHANIVQVYAIGQTDGLWYIALEYVEGRNLRDYLARKGPPDVLLALGIMRQVAAALQRAGELGIIHRDIKPENILLTRKGEVKVADFGLARCLSGDRPALNLTQSGVTMGTPLYMSPEQVEGRPVDARTDIYSFGVTCYHMLAGRPPFQGTTPFEVALQHVRSEPEPLTSVRPDLPAALCLIVHKMLAKGPAQRYQTGRELLRDIARLRESLSGQTGAVLALTQPVELVPVSATTSPSTAGVSGASTPATIAQPAVRRWNWLPLLVGASLLLAVTAGAALAWARHRTAFPFQVAVAPAAEESETTRPQKTEEQALRTMVEQYLTSRPGSADDVQMGSRLCLKLGVFYLEQDRLEDALALFTQLDDKNRPPMYRMLGRVGRGIVLALQSKAVESNQLFHEVYSHVQRPARRVDNQPPQWRYWLTRAVHYNLQNGVEEKDMPLALRHLLGPR